MGCIWVTNLSMTPYGFDGGDVGRVLQRKLGSKSLVELIWLLQKPYDTKPIVNKFYFRASLQVSNEHYEPWFRTSWNSMTMGD
jgi:hypothetical protein